MSRGTHMPLCAFCQSHRHFPRPDAPHLATLLGLLHQRVCLYSHGIQQSRHPALSPPFFPDSARGHQQLASCTEGIQCLERNVGCRQILFAPPDIPQSVVTDGPSTQAGSTESRGSTAAREVFQFQFQARNRNPTSPLDFCPSFFQHLAGMIQPRMQQQSLPDFFPGIVLGMRLDSQQATHRQRDSSHHSSSRIIADTDARTPITEAKRRCRRIYCHPTRRAGIGTAVTSTT